MVAYLSFIYILFVCLFLFWKRDQFLTRYMIGFLIFAWIVLSLVAALRPESMADRSGYYDFWRNLGSDRIEQGFVLLKNLVQYFTDNFNVFLFCSAALSIGIKIFAICKFTSLIWGSLLIYISNIFILHDMIQMRCAIASGLLLFAVYSLEKKKIVFFFIISIIAYLFHYSSLAIFPLLFIDRVRYQKVLYIALIGLSYLFAGALPIELLISYIPIDGIHNLWIAYSNTVGEEVNIFNSVQITRVILCILFIINLEKISVYNHGVILLTKIYAISLSLFVLLSSVPVLAFRISELYQVVEIILIPMIVYAFKGNVFVKRLIVVCVGLCFLLMNIFYWEHLK